jgi:hypothetical protein
MVTEYVCFEQHAPLVDRRRLELAEKTIERLLKDYHFRGLVSASGPISIHWFREKTSEDRALERKTGFQQESVKDASGRYLTGFFLPGDGSLVHLRTDIPHQDVARVLIHELAHASDSVPRPASVKSVVLRNPHDPMNESGAQRMEIILAKYHQGVR